jgi:muconolactone D-isomerase
MEFLVTIETRFPTTTTTEQRDEILARERERGRELIQQGVISRIWRIPGGGLANVGIWNAEDADELHSSITSLPAYPYMTTEVRPLATHPLETGTAPKRMEPAQ